jgi:hypothetical protein
MFEAAAPVGVELAQKFGVATAEVAEPAYFGHTIGGADRHAV